MAFGLIKSLLGFQDKPSGSTEMETAAARIQQISDALASPNLGSYGHLITENEDQIKRDTAASMRELSIADRRQRVRTGTGILNPERRDEAIAQATARSHAGAKDAAREKARSFLTQSLNAQNASMGAYADVAKINASVNAANSKNTARVFDTVLNSIPSFRTLLNGDPTNTPLSGTRSGYQGRVGNFPTIYSQHGAL